MMCPSQSSAVDDSTQHQDPTKLCSVSLRSNKTRSGGKCASAAFALDRLKARRDQEEEVLAAGAEDVADESSSGEYETDSEDEGLGRQMLKPTFTRKQDRDTIAERERLEAEEQKAYEAQQGRLQSRKVETRKLVSEQVAVSLACCPSCRCNLSSALCSACDMLPKSVLLHLFG